MSALELVLWYEGTLQFALETCRVDTLQSITAATASTPGMASLIPGLKAATPAYRLSWQVDGHTCWLALPSEPHHIQLPLAQLWPLPAALQHARRTPALRALGWHRQRPLFILDARQLGHQLQALSAAP